MYFFYIDESGTPESSDNSSRFFVVCSTVFHNSQWPELYGKMEGLKRQFFPKTFSYHESEIKGADLVSKHDNKKTGHLTHAAAQLSHLLGTQNGPLPTLRQIRMDIHQQHARPIHRTKRNDLGPDRTKKRRRPDHKTSERKQKPRGENGEKN